MGLRVYALYGRSKVLGVFLATFLLGWLGVRLWVYLTPSVQSLIIPGPGDVVNSAALHMCLAETSPKLSNLQASSNILLQTTYDSIVLTFILFKTVSDLRLLRIAHWHGMKSVMAKQGVLYYLVVFSANLAWALMILFATNGLKNAIAGPTLIFAPMAANKLTISLRSYAQPESIDGESEPTMEFDRTGMQNGMRRRGSWVGTSTFEIDVDGADP